MIMALREDVARLQPGDSLTVRVAHMQTGDVVVGSEATLAGYAWRNPDSGTQALYVGPIPIRTADGDPAQQVLAILEHTPAWIGADVIRATVYNGDDGATYPDTLLMLQTPEGSYLDPHGRTWRTSRLHEVRVIVARTGQVVPS
jgi:hypothetical protein